MDSANERGRSVVVVEAVNVAEVSKRLEDGIE